MSRCFLPSVSSAFKVSKALSSLGVGGFRCGEGELKGGGEVGLGLPDEGFLLAVPAAIKKNLFTASLFSSVV